MPVCSILQCIEGHLHLQRSSTDETDRSLCIAQVSHRLLTGEVLDTVSLCVNPDTCQMLYMKLINECVFNSSMFPKEFSVRDMTKGEMGLETLEIEPGLHSHCTVELIEHLHGNGHSTYM